MFTSLRAAAVSLACLTASTAGAATLVLDPGGNLLGAEGVSVNGTLYNVSFTDGSCVSLFDGCDELSDFDFQTFDDAGDAAQALFDQVFLGIYDTDTALTRGCEGGGQCLAAIPYNPRGSNADIRGADNRPGTDPNIIAGFGTGAAFDYVNSTILTYAVFEIAAIPLPASAFLLIGALGGVFAVRKTREA